MARGRAKGNVGVILEKETVDAIPYPVEVRMISENGIMFNNWKWEAKIEEVGILAYGNTKEDAFKSAMDKYKEMISME